MDKDNLIKRIRKYEKPVDELLRQAEQEDKERGLLGLVLGSTLAEPLRKTHKPVPRIYEGERYGFLTILEGRTKVEEGSTKYLSLCSCGEELYLTATEVAKRYRLLVGCMGRRCPFGSIEAKVWFNSEFALWVQHSLLQSRHVLELDNNWGGRVYEEVDTVTPDEGFIAFLQDVEPMIDESHKKWWIHRVNVALPYSAFNIEVSNKPDPEVLEMNTNVVQCGEAVYSVKQVARMFGVDEEMVRRLRKATVSDAALMDIVIAEGACDGK